MIKRLLPNWELEEDYTTHDGLKFTLYKPKEIEVITSIRKTIAMVLFINTICSSGILKLKRSKKAPYQANIATAIS